jgi:NAD(P)-dependent dehydrogenase (short-subunit alcohol dehydrogenase family)
MKEIIMDLQLRGKKAIVTGATRGIGRAAAAQLAAEGADVAICARTQAEVDKFAEELRAEGVNAVGGAVDLYDMDAYQQWLAQAADALGGVDIFVSNVTGGTAMGADAATAWQGFFDVDLMCAVRGFETLLPQLKASDAASVIFVSSTAALEHFPPSPPGFMALKAALITQAKTLSHHHGKDGIRVNAVSPGPVFVDGGAWEFVRDNMPELYEQTLGDIPLGRMGSAEEIGRYIAFVASPCASFITGANCIIDGGMTRTVG